MKAKDTIEKQLTALSEDERGELESLIQDLTTVLKGRKINEDVVKKTQQRLHVSRYYEG